MHNPQGGEVGAAKRALGAAQYSGVGYDNGFYGCLVIYAPGPLDETAARAAIRAEMTTELSRDALNQRVAGAGDHGVVVDSVTVSVLL